MATVAPWEDPNLPAPLAKTERFTKDRVRRFALWFWEGRLVWRDINHPHYWWAALDYSGSDALEAWENAIETGNFGRATSAKYEFSGDGTWFGLPREVSFIMHAPREFYLIRNASNGGSWRASNSENWQSFQADEKACVQSEAINLSKRNPDIWHIARVFPSAKIAISKSFIPTMANTLSSDLRRCLEAGGNNPPMVIARDFLTLIASRTQGAHPREFFEVFNTQLQSYSLENKLLRHFDLPRKTQLFLFYESDSSCILSLGATNEGISWNLNVQIPFSPTAHERLELQLRLRESLKPILTPAEIEEILAPAARL